MLQFRMTPSQFASKQAAVEAEVGHPIDGTSGIIAHNNVTLRYAYDGSALTVEVVKKPLMLPMAIVESKIKSWFETA